MSLIAIVRIAHHDLALSPTIRECSDMTIHVIPHAGTDPETGLFLFFVENTHKSFETTLTNDHTVSEWTLVADSETGSVYRMRHPPEAKLVSPKTLELGGLMIKAVSDQIGWTVRLQFPDHEALSHLWEYCKSEEISFDLRRVFRQQDWTNSEPSPVTDAQRDALTVAYEEGYFEEPRDISLEELSDILDLSPTAVGGRIRRGMAELVATMLTKE